ncbi:ABC transporter substrate-binding protein [Ammoniphilus sp. YIM 78166]|uniref:ABC transporter substrate-binding protein n=1 Tax=Ammoniphilus sp. YIM 78166 TaxID=1644106 RepID=UPI00106FDFA9|nr:ABC transporter substrate-binding protein [Ammoniphilus sp. YIM 78166]
MNRTKFLLTLSLICVMGLIALGCSSASESSQSNGERETQGQELSDEIRVAYPTQPHTLDPHMTSNAVTKEIGRHIFETLVTLNSKYQPVPMLAERVEQSEDGKTYTFHLRKGIKFHNGKEMTAEDVVTSMNRWVEKNTATKAVIGNSKYEVQDNDTVVLALDNSSMDLLLLMGSPKQFAAIMPKELIESADAKGVTEVIGTGPYQFVEWKQDQHVLLTRYDNYQPVESSPDGLAGKKEAFIKDIRFSFVSDLSTREIGLQSGEYDIATQLQPDSYDNLKSDANLRTFPVLTTSVNVMFNKKAGLFTDLKMRQAVNAALDIDSLFQANPGISEFYRIDPAYMFKEQEDWYIQDTLGQFNQKDPEKAKQLLAEAGYQGEEIRLLTTRDYSYSYDHAVVIKDQLEKLGMKVKLEVYDWPTLTDLRTKPDKYDMLMGGYTLVPTPSQVSILSPDYYGWTNDEKMAQVLTEMTSSASMDEFKKKWQELQQASWDYLPMLKLGDMYTLSATTSKVEGYKEFEGVRLWNVKVYK